MNSQSLPRAVQGVVAGDFSDPTNERIIILSAAGLVAIGLALLLGTIVWWRRARQEHPSLAPLEVMGARAWTKAPEGDRRRRLDQVRRSGSAALGDGSTVAEPVDLEALVRSVPEDFDDLREPSEVIELPPPSGEPVVVEPAKQGGTVEPAEAEEAEPAEAEEVVDPDATEVSLERPPEALASGSTELSP